MPFPAFIEQMLEPDTFERDFPGLAAKIPDRPGRGLWPENVDLRISETDPNDYLAASGAYTATMHAVCGFIDFAVDDNWTCAVGALYERHRKQCGCAALDGLLRYWYHQLPYWRTLDEFATWVCEHGADGIYTVISLERIHAEWTPVPVDWRCDITDCFLPPNLAPAFAACSPREQWAWFQRSITDIDHFPRAHVPYFAR